ncbi:DUF4102 domain-containing protein [Duganella sp. BJB475]|nr:DUF4102 domain-containing protein [Duganella sp. BJB475]
MTKREATMPKRVMPLIEALIEQAAPKEKPYRLFDGGGLYLEVLPGGSKVWRMKFRQHDGREKVLTFGHYPEVAIDKAREYRLTVRQLLKQKQDPRPEFSREKLHPPPKPIPLDEMFEEPERRHVQSSISRASQHAIHDLEAALFPSLARIPTDDARRSIQRVAIRQAEHAGLQSISRQLESVAIALVASYLRSGMSMNELVSAMKDTRNRTRRADDTPYTGRRASKNRLQDIR